MDPKTLNALVHDREASFYDDRFLIDFSRVASGVRRDLQRLLGTLPRAQRALDVACGTGYGAVGVAAAGLARETHACDISTAMLARARANSTTVGAPVRLALADAERLPYASASFDLVLARGALHHLPDPTTALHEMRRVLEPGGTVVVLAEPTPGGERQVGAVVGRAVRIVERLKRPNPADDERKHWELASIAANLHTFEPEQLASMAQKAGFDQIHVTTASWAWILALGLNYYLVGEFEGVARSEIARAFARTVTGAAGAFDRAFSDRFVPAHWRHTVQAVLR